MKKKILYASLTLVMGMMGAQAAQASLLGLIHAHEEATGTSHINGAPISQPSTISGIVSQSAEVEPYPQQTLGYAQPSTPPARTIGFSNGATFASLNDVETFIGNNLSVYQSVLSYLAAVPAGSPLDGAAFRGALAAVGFTNLDLVDDSALGTRASDIQDVLAGSQKLLVAAADPAQVAAVESVLVGKAITPDDVVTEILKTPGSTDTFVADGFLASNVNALVAAVNQRRTDLTTAASQAMGILESYKEDHLLPTNLTIYEEIQLAVVGNVTNDSVLAAVRSASFASTLPLADVRADHFDAAKLTTLVGKITAIAGVNAGKDKATVAGESRFLMKVNTGTQAAPTYTHVYVSGSKFFNGLTNSSSSTGKKPYEYIVNAMKADKKKPKSSGVTYDRAKIIKLFNNNFGTILRDVVSASDDPIAYIIQEVNKP